MENAALSSGSLAVGTDVVLASPGLIMSIILNPGSASSTLTIYDNASTNSGTVLASLVAAANTSSVAVSFNFPIYTTKGITAVVAGTSATAVVHYIKSY